SVEEVAAALRASNENVSAGFFEQGGVEVLVEGRGRLQDEAGIAATVVATRNGVAIRLDELGDVRVGEAPKRGEGSSGGLPAVVVGVQKQPDVNTLALTEELDRVLDDVEAALPAGVQIDRHV